MIWASHASSSVVYVVLNTGLFSVRILFCDDETLLDALTYRLLKAEHLSRFGVAAMVDRSQAAS